MEPEMIIILLVGMIILVLTVVLIIFYVTARILRVSSTGLQNLISRFPVSDVPDGDTFSRQTIQINNIYYRNCVTIIVAHSGLYLSIFIPFPWIPGGKTLIPWGEVSIDGEERIYWKMATRLKVKGLEPVFITIPGDIARLLPIT